MVNMWFYVETPGEDRAEASVNQACSRETLRQEGLQPHVITYTFVCMSTSKSVFYSWSNLQSLGTNSEKVKSKNQLHVMYPNHVG